MVSAGAGSLSSSILGNGQLTKMTVPAGRSDFVEPNAIVLSTPREDL